MQAIFTPNEAAAFAYLPPKRVYKELEYQIIESVSDNPRLPFVALIYLRALKEINFEFSVNYRSLIYQRLVKAWENQAIDLEIAKFFILQLDKINQELKELISEFNQWKAGLVSDPNIKGGEIVFSNSRLSVAHIGGMLEKGESFKVILEDYPYLTQKDLNFASLYVKAYPTMGRPKKE
ncbi:DUF433 domain-containing protein [Gloeocapsa sp. PCC 73106]|uniref:DUF433 domain-containing protein n=1 Tax=Gloeocapsa sp. PCC 73106 TaxID=102232 RepID=UPI0002AC2EEF|nr:DUF433 domain-containing protein [Gloeocapsa sp. PCC 73106]ELR97661.1 hypothetical protein GLO73106DRAFT_00014740 [Gloeocapsa sp. PCC 73106]